LKEKSRPVHKFASRQWFEDAIGLLAGRNGCGLLVP
jgi:hypothetical protein